MKDPFEVQEGRYDFPQDTAVEIASSRLEGKISWFFSSCGRSLSSYDWDLRDQLVWPQERPVAMLVARDLSGFFSSGFWVLSHHLELMSEPEVSSSV